MKTANNQAAPSQQGNRTTKEQNLEKVNQAGKQMEDKMNSEDTEHDIPDYFNDEHEHHLLNEQHMSHDLKARSCMLIFVNGDKLTFTLTSGIIADKMQQAREYAEETNQHFCIGDFCEDMTNVSYNDLPILHYHYSNSIHPSKFTTLIV